MTITGEQIQGDLSFVYGPATAAEIWPKLQTRLEVFRQSHPVLQQASLAPEQRVSERDIILITYGDQIQEPNKPPLQTLDETLTALIGETINTVHILPFYPYTSDDGFSVVDYKAVHPDWGTWDEIQQMSMHFRLMFDAVINHISQASDWFQEFLQGQEPYTDYFLAPDPATDLSQVVRPRTSPLLTPYETADGVKHVWTTFSADQVDLNYGSPTLLLEVIDVLLFYVAMGARLIRLDAIAFMWKEPGTTSLHLPQTHRLIQLLRSVLDEVAPDVLLITETNVPHAENISYFGDGTNEAQLVYNFTLPPLTLHAFRHGDATKLSTWAATLATPSQTTTFFNFMASHDGVGLRPVEGILTSEEIQALATQVQAHGGLVSYRNQPDGSQSPYELNIVYFDALNNPNSSEAQQTQVDRFLASQAVLLSLAGVPGIYVHSLFGSRNWQEGVAATSRNRTINRRKFQRVALENALAESTSIPHQVFTRYTDLIKVRTTEPAFHPNSPQRILNMHPALFAILRGDPATTDWVLCLHNVANHAQMITLDPTDLGIAVKERLTDLIANQRYVTTKNGQIQLTINPYMVLWLR